MQSRFLMPLFCVALVCATPNQSYAECNDAELQTLKKENAKLKQKIKELESKQATKPEAKPALSKKEQAAKAKKDALAQKDPKGFGKVKWGMSPKQARKKYKGKFAQNILAVENYKLTGYKGILGLKFHKNKLTQAIWMLGQRYTNKNKYIDVYYEIGKLLQKKYGTPPMDDVTWSKDMFKDKPKSHGMALSLGHVSYQMGWDVGSTRIVLMLKGNNLEVDLNLVYMDLEAVRQQNKDDDKKTLEGL